MITTKPFDYLLNVLDDWYKQQTSFGIFTSKKTKEDVIAQVDAIYNTLITEPVWVCYNSVVIDYDIKTLEQSSFDATEMYILDLRINDKYSNNMYTNIDLSPPPVLAIPKNMGDDFFNGHKTISLISTIYGFINPKDNAISQVNAIPNVLLSIVGMSDKDAMMELYTRKCIQCTNEFIIN